MIEFRDVAVALGHQQLRVSQFLAYILINQDINQDGSSHNFPSTRSQRFDNADRSLLAHGIAPSQQAKVVAPAVTEGKNVRNHTTWAASAVFLKRRPDAR